MTAFRALNCMTRVFCVFVHEPGKLFLNELGGPIAARLAVDCRSTSSSLAPFRNIANRGASVSFPFLNRL